VIFLAVKNDPDYLLPFNEENNRNEIFIVEYDGVLRNFNEAILRAMILDYKKWIHKYPEIINYFQFTSDELYEFSVNVDTVTMLSTLKHDRKTSDKDRKEIEEDIKSLLPINTDWLHITRMQIALYNIISSKVVRHLYIVNDGMDEKLRNYIASSVPNNEDARHKISLVNGTITEVLNDHPEATTLMMRRSEELYDISMKNPDILKDKLIILNDTMENMEPNKEGNLNRKHFDYFEKLQIKKHCNIFYAFPSCVSDTRLDAKG